MAVATVKRKKRKLKLASLWRLAKRALFSMAESPEKRALSVALATFIAFTPLYGLQTILGIALAFALRLNKMLVIVLINIITPYPLVPLIIYFSFKIGGWLVPTPVQMGKGQDISTQFLQENFTQYMAGGLLLAVVMGALLGGGSYLLFRRLHKKHAAMQTL